VPESAKAGIFSSAGLPGFATKTLTSMRYEFDSLSRPFSM
jgi:hypothetical protein